MQKRRRVIFFGLLVAMALFLGLGFVPGLRAIWALHVVCDCLLAIYVGLLIHFRNLAVQREMRLRLLLPPAPIPEAALLLRRPGA